MCCNAWNRWTFFEVRRRGRPYDLDVPHSVRIVRTNQHTLLDLDTCFQKCVKWVDKTIKPFTTCF